MNITIIQAMWQWPKTPHEYVLKLQAVCEKKKFSASFIPRPAENHTSQPSKSTFSKSRLLATFNCKMVAIKRNSVAKKILEGEDTLWHFTQRANAPNSTFSTLRFATVRERERERRDCLVANTIYFNITKLPRPDNIANGAQNPFESIKFAILSRSSF